MHISVITCDPPDPIPHTSYLPNNLIEHAWNTPIEYTCDTEYHYVSGGNITTCNESGSFPPSDVNCSGKFYHVYFILYTFLLVSKCSRSNLGENFRNICVLLTFVREDAWGPLIVRIYNQIRGLEARSFRASIL